MMRLASFRAGVPVFAVRSEVAHLTPRVPTVFEKMVLRLVEAAQGHPAIGGSSLRAAFEDMLGVADAPLLLAPCLDELRALQVLVAPDTEDALEAPLSAWRLSEQGRDFWHRGLLPRRPRHETVMHGYDPVSGDVTPWREGVASEQVSQAQLDGTAPGIDFGPLVRAALQRQRPAWLKPATEITSVQADVVETRWRTVALQLDVAGDGTLALRAVGDEAFDGWLRRAQPEVVWERLIAPALGGTQAQPGRGAPALSLADVVAVSPAVDVPGAELKASPGRGWALTVLAGDEPPPSASADVVHLRSPTRWLGWWAQKPEAPQAPDGGIAVQLDAPPGLPAGLRRIEISCAGAPPRGWTEGSATLYWCGQGRQVRLRAELSASQGQAAWEMVRAELEDWLASQAQVQQLAMAAWTEPAEVAVARWLRHAASSRPVAWFKEFAAFVSSLQARLGVSGMLDEQPWAAAVRDACARTVDGAGRVLSLAEGIELLQALRQLPLRQQPLARVVLSRVTPRDHMAELQRLREVVGDAAIFLPASLLGEPVRRELLRAALDGEVPPGCGAHELQSPLQAFSQAYRQARREVPATLLDEPVASSPAWHRALRTQPARTLSAVKTLQHAMAEVLAALELPQAALATPAARLQALRQAMDAMLAPALSQGRRAVVIDTNALLDVPDLFEHMPAQDVPVVARAVIEELDGLKQPRPPEDPDKQSLAQRARRASRALQQAADRIVFEGSRREQCAADLPATPDNEILAVAAYHALSPVLLLSTDRNLCLTAKGVGVPAQAPQDYLKTIGKPQAPARPARDRSTVR